MVIPLNGLLCVISILHYTYFNGQYYIFNSYSAPIGGHSFNLLETQHEIPVDTSRRAAYLGGGTILTIPGTVSICHYIS